MGSVRATRGSAVLLSASLLLSACGGDDGGGGAQPDDPGSTTTAAPTSTTAEGDAGLVLADSFDDDSNLWIEDPTQYEGAGVEPAIDNALIFRGIDGDGLLDMWPSALDDRADTLTDQRVEATVSFTSPGTAHVICRLDPGVQTLYVASISSAGVYAVQKVVDGELQGGDLLATTPPEFKEAAESGIDPSQAIFTPAFDGASQELHEVALECVGGAEGTTITLFDGGDEVLSVEDTDSPILTGLGGLGAQASGFQVAVDGFEPYGVVADDFVLTDLSAG